MRTGPVSLRPRAGPWPVAPAAPVHAGPWFRRASFWQTAFVALGIVLYSGARLVLSPAEADEADLGAANPINTAVQVLLLTVSAAWCARHPRKALLALRRLLPIVLLVGLLAASSLWSQSPMHSFRRSVSMATVLLFTVFAHEALGPRRLMRLVVNVMLGACVASLMEAVFRPAVGFDVAEYANAVRGVFPQKNGLGAVLMLAALALSFLVLDRGALRPADGAILGVLLVMLVLSRSTTSLVLTLAIAAGTVALLAMDRGGRWLFATVILAGLGATAVLVALSVLGPSVVFDLLGKEDTLTGRTQIWEAVGWAIRSRPWLGHGFAAFWLPGTNGAETVWQVMYWQVPSAHSGYREILLDVGVLGASLVLAAVLLTALRAVAALRGGRRRHALWSLLLLAILAFYNFSESALLQPGLAFLYWTFAEDRLARREPRARPAPRPPPPRTAVRGEAALPGGAAARP